MKSLDQNVPYNVSSSHSLKNTGGIRSAGIFILLRRRFYGTLPCFLL